MPTLPNNWLNSSIIYQIFTGRWQGANLIEHPGQVFTKLSQTNFQPLLDSGLNCIYLLGVFDNRGPIIVSSEEGVDLSASDLRLPSVFAISDHKNTNPLLGSLADLKNLIHHLQESGFRVILDFVPNHTSTVHPWTVSHPDFYHKSDGSFVAEFSGDVYKLNYQNPELAAEMLEVLRFISSLGVDGVRVDMAHLVPQPFWQHAIGSIKSEYPDFIFLAEAYPDSPFDLTPLQDLLHSGFNAVYNGHLYHNLKAVLQGESIDHLISHINHTNTAFEAGTLLNYISNHDDDQNEAANTHVEALLSLILFQKGIPFIYNGSLLGRNKRLSHHSFDMLSNSQVETNGTPNLLEIFKFKENYSPILENLSATGPLITGSLHSDSKDFTFFANLSSDPAKLDSAPSNKGLIHSLSSESRLMPGQIEIF